MKRHWLCVMLFGLAMLCMTGCEIDKGKGGDNKVEASTTMADLVDIYNLSDSVCLTVINGVVNDDRSIRSDGEVYIPFSAVKSLDSRFYYNRDEEQLIVTSPTEILYFWPDRYKHMNKEKEVQDKVPLLRTFDGHLYVASSLFLKYADVSTRILDSPARVVMFTNGVTYESVSVKQDTAIRIGASVQKDIVTEVKEGDRVILTGESVNGFMTVSTEDGQVGYISEADCGEKKSILIHETTKKYDRISGVQHVHMMWHQMWSVQGGENLRTALNGTSGINVIAPTWFDFKTTEGDIVSFASASYVEEAHARGMQVWALCSDFADNVKGYDVLSRTESRQRLEQNLVEEVVRVGADGINLDFEYITKDSGPHYMQFIRELYLLCREHNLVLSIADFVPSAGKSQYDLQEQAVIADYLIFMAYDEHYKGSGAGSVASYPWVEAAVNSALQVVPPEKFVLGLSLFNRVWITDKEGNLSIENGGMSTVREQAVKGGATLAWDENNKQYYGEYTTKDGSRYQYWIEDVESLSYKVKLISQHQLAGYAGWKLGLESSDVWNLLNDY